MDNAPWLGRPVEVGRDQIETLIENNQRYTTWEIAEILKISKSINENEKYVFYFMEKTKWPTFWTTDIYQIFANFGNRTLKRLSWTETWISGCQGRGQRRWKRAGPHAGKCGRCADPREAFLSAGEIEGSLQASECGPPVE